MTAACSRAEHGYENDAVFGLAGYWAVTEAPEFYAVHD
jgi:hypothetical protein